MTKRVLIDRRPLALHRMKHHFRCLDGDSDQPVLRDEFWARALTIRTYGTETPTLWQKIKRWLKASPGEL